jgi:hypothetical protein
MCEVFERLNMLFKEYNRKYKFQQKQPATHNNNNMIKEFTPNWATSP